jgi:hypothetical protein
LDENGICAYVSPWIHVKKCLPRPAVFMAHYHVNPAFIPGEKASNPGVDERNKK